LLVIYSNRKITHYFSVNFMKQKMVSSSTKGTKKKLINIIMIIRTLKYVYEYFFTCHLFMFVSPKCNAIDLLLWTLIFFCFPQKLRLFGFKRKYKVNAFARWWTWSTYMERNLIQVTMLHIDISKKWCSVILSRKLLRAWKLRLYIIDLYFYTNSI
jgi:hypothetical protein